MWFLVRLRVIPSEVSEQEIKVCLFKFNSTHLDDNRP